MRRMRVMGLIGLMALLGAGCSLNSSMPKTTISGSVGGEPFSISTPKDSSLTGLNVSASTNGTVTVHIDQLTATLSPTNVAAAGTAEAQIISATSDAIQKGISAGAAAAGTALGAAAKTP